MKLTLILLFLIILQSTAGVFSQKISVNVKNQSLREVLKVVESQTNYRFFYNDQLSGLNKAISLRAENLSVEELLSQLLDNQQFAYTAMENNMIVIAPKEFMQQPGISGTVTDPGGNPLPGVSIIVKGTTIGTITDLAGKFEMAVPADARVLIFSFMGMQTQEIAIDDRAIFNIQLQEDVFGLEEVVAIGYGSVRSSRLSTAIAKVGADKLDMTSGVLTSALIGKLSGVQVSQIRGTPGRDIDIRVRGVNSINYSLAPLYVVDGYPITGGLNSVNMSDIASIEVLKDAASASIYGSRASNGVVLITTKRGKAGAAPSINFNASYGLQERFSKVTTRNRDQEIEWEIDVRNQRHVRAGGNAADPNSVRAAGNQINPVWLSDPGSLPDTDWQEAVDRIAPIQNYQLSSTGGSDKINYYISGDYMDQQGILINSYFNRLSFKTNLDADLGKIAKMGITISASATERNDPDTDSWYSWAGGAGALNTAITMSPYIALDEQVVGNMNPWTGASQVNPYLWMKETLYRTKESNLLGNMYLDLNLAKNLFWRTSIGGERRASLTEYFIKNYIARNRGSLGDVQNNFNENFLAESIFRWNIDRTDWSFDIMGGGTYQGNYGSSSGMSGTGYPDEDIYTLNQASIMRSLTSSASQWRLISFLSRANLAVLDKYIFTTSIRRDGSSRFGRDNRWGWFPSVSFAWRLSEEPFMQEFDWLSVKPRVSWGIVGNNNIGNYPSVASLGGTNAIFGTGKSIFTGLAPTGFSNTMLGWEATYTTNAGIDIGLLDNRVQITVDYYIANTKDLLLNLPIPQVTGFSSSLQNVGEVQNKGVELELNTINLNGAFGWNTSFNISHYRNKVIDLVSPIYGNHYGTATITKVGEPIGSYYLLTKVGVFQTQADLEEYPKYGNQRVGDSRYLDINDDGVVDIDDWSIVGSPHPDFYYGIRNTFSYGGFSLSVDIDGSVGNERLHARGGLIQYLHFDDHRGHAFYDRWQSEAEPGNGWRAGILDPTSTIPSTNWMMSGAFFAIRNITLNYNVPQPVLKILGGLSGLRMYFNVVNVLSIDEYWGMPQSASRSQSATGTQIDYRTGYPLARTYTFGVDINF